MVVAPCFLKNTEIMTAHGKVRVNNLKIGDRVQTSNDKFSPVKFIGKRVLIKTDSKWIPQIEPILIKKDAFGLGTPVRDLYVSPEHAIYLEGLFYRAEELVNEKTIARMGETPENEIEYFHIDLGFHDLVYAEGIPTESFGGVTREHFDNCEEFYKLYGKEQEVYKPFAPFAYSYKQRVAKVGDFVGKHLPESIKNLGKPLAHKIYDGVSKLERRSSK
jgi:hypothetical protein